MAKASHSLMAGVRFWFTATGMPSHLDYPVLYEPLNTPSSWSILKLLQDGADYSTNTPVSTMVLYPGTGYRYDMQRLFCRKIWIWSFTSVMWITFFKMHGWRSDQRFAWEKKRKNPLFLCFERPACFFFCIIRPWCRAGAGCSWFTVGIPCRWCFQTDGENSTSAFVL